MLDSSRILNVEQGTFTTLIEQPEEWEECLTFLKKLSQLIPTKRKEKLSLTACSIYLCKISDALL